MGKINLGRVLLCGILTGGILYVLQLLVFLFVLRGTDFAAAVEAASVPTFAALPFILYLGIGIWAIWLYAAIRPRYGPGPKTATVAGLALWVMAILVDLLWVSSRLTPIPLGTMLAPAFLSLPIVVVATVVGAWPYKE